MPRKLTIEEINQKIKQKWPNWHFQVMNYINAMSPCKIKCLDCGAEKEYKQLYHLLNKQTPCICTSNSSQYKSKQQIMELNQFLSQSPEFNLVEWTTTSDSKHKPAVKIQHIPCGRTFTRRTTTFYNDHTCPYCNGHTLPDTIEIAQRCKEKGYTLLSEYKNLQTKVLLKHDKCGFIWEIKPYRFYHELDGDCPKCNRAISKGERRIMEYLIQHHINYNREYSFQWQTHKAYRYDYFIPDYNLIIEYHGIQHYEETNFLHETLEENQAHDEIKLQEAINNNLNYLVIPYTHYEKISSILDNWFNDYPQGVNNKLMVIERDVIFNKR